MAKKLYKVEMDLTYHTFKVEIDEDFSYKSGNSSRTCKQDIKDMVEFWHNWQSLLEDNNGDYTKAFLMQLGTEVFPKVVEMGHMFNLAELISHFDDKEGWCSMDGSSGIKIIECEIWSIVPHEFVVEEITA